jgi:hypothetical protein
MTTALATAGAVLAALPDEPEPITSAFHRAAALLVDPDALGVPVTEAGWEGVSRTLALRWAYAAGQVLDLEAGGDRGALAALPSSRADWTRRLTRYPGLVPVLDQVSDRWRVAMRELFSRLAADRALLAGTGLFGAEPGPLTAFRGDLGDRHAGRSVAILSFGAESVVYKPKDMRHAEVFQDLLAWLSGRLPLPLASHRVVCGDGYGWEAMIEPAPGRDEAGFGRYYRRLGMLTRLVQLLDGRDMWADNLIAVGDQPVLVDLECLLAPPVPDLWPGELGDLLADSVVLTGILCQPWNLSAVPEVADVGCLSRVGRLRAADGTPALPLPPYLPSTAAGVTADPWHYHAELIQGYREMHAVLAAAATELPARLAPLRTARVRVIRRSTWDYYAMLRTSLAPRTLTVPGARERTLAALPAAAVRLGRPDLATLAGAESVALGAGDIPLFGAIVDSTAILGDDGARVDHFYGTTAWDRLTERIGQLPDFPVDEHAAIVSGCLEVAREATEITPVPDGDGGPLPGDWLAGDWLAGAVEIGELILDRWRNGWFGLSWYPVTGLRQIGVLDPDLAGGSAGLAVFLGELARVTGEDRYRARCRQVLLDAADAVLSTSQPRVDRRVAGRMPVPGGLFGPGAVLHALARCGQCLADTGLLDRASDLVEVAGRLAADRGTAGPGPGPGSGPAAGPGSGPGSGPAAGLAAGRAGLLVNLLRLRRARPGRTGPDSLIAKLAAGAAADLAAGVGAPLPSASRQVVQRLPAGADGVALALAYALRWAPDLVSDPDAATELVHQHSFAADWGGRLAAAAATQPPPPAVTSGTGTASCRDLVARATELLLAGGDRTEQLDELIARRRASGRWYADRVIADHLNLGAVDGLADIGLVLLGAPPVSVLH